MSKALLICPVDGKARTEAELDEHLQRCSHCAEFIEDMALPPHNMPWLNLGTSTNLYMISAIFATISILLIWGEIEAKSLLKWVTYQKKDIIPSQIQR